MDAEAHVLDTMIGSDTLLHFHHDESPESTVSVETDLETRISSLYITDKISQQRYPGMAEAHRQIMEVLMYPVMYPELISHLNLDCPKGASKLSINAHWTNHSLDLYRCTTSWSTWRWENKTRCQDCRINTNSSCKYVYFPLHHSLNF